MVGYVILWLQKISIKRLKRKVNSSIFLFKSLERSWLPYNKSWIKVSFGRSVICTNGSNNSTTLTRRSSRGTSNGGQSNKKCSVSSIPSLVGHIEFMDA